MRRIFVISIVLATILGLLCASLMAQESGERSEESERQRVEEGRRAAERSSEELIRALREDEAAMEERRREDQRLRDETAGLYRRLLAELERQREEIRALRREISALREMMEEQFALTRPLRVRRWRAQQRRLELRRELEDRPYRELREPERDVRRDPDVGSEVRELEREVERRPEDIQLRMKLASAYLKVGKVEAAIEQYKMALKINPDFDPPYRALRELGYKFPDEPRERERPLEDSVGEVISSNEQEIRLRNREGDLVTFRVPSIQKDDGSWVLNQDFAEFAKSLKPGTQVKILWWEDEGHRIIHRIEKLEEE